MLRFVENRSDQDELIDHAFEPSDDGPEPFCLVCAAHGFTTLIGDHQSMARVSSLIWFRTFAELMAGAALHFDAYARA